MYNLTLNLLRFVILCISHYISTFSDERKSWVYSKGRGKKIFFSHCPKEIMYTAPLLKHLPPKGRGQISQENTPSIIIKRKSKAEKRGLYIEAKTNR
jgi:hypothetical protein